MKTLRTPYLALIFSFLITGVSHAQGYQVGDVATDFDLPAVDGRSIGFSDYPQAKGFILVFTCNTCPYARAYESRIMDLDKRFASLGFPVIAINPNNPEVQPGDSFEAMKQRSEAKGYTFPYLLDEGQKVYPKYGATRTPQVFILQRSEGEVRVRYIGTIDDNYQDAGAVKTRYVEQAVEALLNGKEIPLQTTRAIGCSIKA
jgi:peroxiredoxin